MEIDPFTSEARMHVVVNADDLGLHRDINRGIWQAHHDGIVTSSSIVACGEAFEDGVDIIRRSPELGVGVHLTLLQEKPISDPGRITSLINSQGRFVRSYRQFSSRILKAQIKCEELRLELEAQIIQVLREGIQPSHLDSHQHLHVLPQVWSVATELAEKYRIPYIRVPLFDKLWSGTWDLFEDFSRIGLNLLCCLRRRGLKGLNAAESTIVSHLSGKLKATDLVDIAQRLRKETCEIVVHPGVNTPELESKYRWGYDWTGELSALTSDEVRKAFEREGACLMNYRELCEINSISVPVKAASNDLI